MDLQKGKQKLKKTCAKRIEYFVHGHMLETMLLSSQILHPLKLNFDLSELLKIAKSFSIIKTSHSQSSCKMESNSENILNKIWQVSLLVGFPEHNLPIGTLTKNGAIY